MAQKLGQLQPFIAVLCPVQVWSAQCVKRPIVTRAHVPRPASSFAVGGAECYIGSHDMYTEFDCTDDGNSADDHDTGFVWTDGTPTDYTNWNNGEPNDWNGSVAGGANCEMSTEGAGGEDCTRLRGDSLWNDVGCAGSAKFLCGYV